MTSSDAQVPIAALCKKKDGATYVFATSLRDTPTTATFTVGGAGAARVEVIGEGRMLKANGGTFNDSFDGYGVHLYRVSP